jgi:hypothetical protein
MSIHDRIFEIIKKLELRYDFNDYVKPDLDDVDVDDVDAIIEAVEVLNEDYQMTNKEIIYYANAIEYLAKNDQSLAESLSIANDYGYDLEKLNSEVLASLLASQNNLEDRGAFLVELRDELEKAQDQE